MSKLSLIGVNTVHYNIDEIVMNELNRFEVCFGRVQNYEERINEINKEIESANKYNLKFSIHHPILLFDWYKYDYLSAFYLDSDADIREKSFKLLEENIKKYSNVNAEYFVIHFPGVVLSGEKPIDFNKTLCESINRVNKIALEYDVIILFEYFGSNKWFYEIDDWIKNIKGHSNIGILTDTGHLYFSSIMHNFDFAYALRKLGKESSAFHLWTTKGEGVYSDSEFYKKYHHISVNTDQTLSDGWAFDTKEVLDIILEYNKPIIIEASPIYGGIEYLEGSLKSIINYVKEKDNGK